MEAIVDQDKSNHRAELGLTGELRGISIYDPKTHSTIFQSYFFLISQQDSALASYRSTNASSQAIVEETVNALWQHVLYVDQIPASARGYVTATTVVQEFCDQINGSDIEIIGKLIEQNARKQQNKIESIKNLTYQPTGAEIMQEQRILEELNDMYGKNVFSAYTPKERELIQLALIANYVEYVNNPNYAE